MCTTDAYCFSHGELCQLIVPLDIAFFQRVYGPPHRLPRRFTHSPTYLLPHVSKSYRTAEPPCLSSSLSSPLNAVELPPPPCPGRHVSRFRSCAPPVHPRRAQRSCLRGNYLHVLPHPGRSVPRAVPAPRPAGGQTLATFFGVCAAVLDVPWAVQTVSPVRVAGRPTRERYRKCGAGLEGARSPRRILVSFARTRRGRWSRPGRIRGAFASSSAQAPALLSIFRPLPCRLAG
ncbi:hypothetical protein PHLGIDRAFT_256843 [Phlebiopsis gigantea 11061_1 CR5-6]|uniref:Uncharacterized protein n=1 Tax=Phlebiopsis gigantea (strain 11061_1 CR5-6) TaxID=745531 RepID=A0A0C3NEJ9_PHLG1|nr:hypothetical protein PHLGIDRAFT_256843 [Phlebiopsis gigantea 11061_1 CR5-6]